MYNEIKKQGQPPKGEKMITLPIWLLVIIGIFGLPILVGIIAITVICFQISFKIIYEIIKEI